MNVIRKTSLFDSWLSGLKDSKGKLSVLRKIAQLEQGNFSDCKHINGSLFEIKINISAGYRVYYTRQDNIVYLLLLGGDKSTQQKDINKAQSILEKIEKGEYHEYR